MPTTLRHTLLSLRDLLATGVPFIALALGLLALAYWVLDPTPPKKIVLATGSDQGAYAEFGKRYMQILKGYGITVELRTTQGAAENLQLLRDPDSGVDIAFVQGGAGDGAPLNERIDSNGASVEPGHLVAGAVACREHDDRRGVVARTQGSQHPQASGGLALGARRSAGGQAEVEQHQIEPLSDQRAVGGGCVAHPVDRVPLQAQGTPQAVADHAVVFHQQQAHWEFTVV